MISLNYILPFLGAKAWKPLFSQKYLISNLLIQLYLSTVTLALSLSEQPLTAFAKLSYGKRDFAKAASRKTENGEGKVSTVLKSP